MNEIKTLKEIESQIKEINRKLIAEKRKTIKAKLMIKKRKLIKQYKILKKELLVKHKNHELDIWQIDLTAISVKPLKAKKSRYLKIGNRYYNDYNLLVAYNFNLGYGYAILTKFQQITKKDLAKLISLLPKDSITITDNRHKYTNNMNKSFTMEIERLFSWIKKPIYKEIRNIQINTIEQLVNIYKKHLAKRNIIAYGF